MWPCPTVSQAVSRAHAIVLSPLLVTIQSFYRNTGPCRAPCRRHCRACRNVPAPCPRALLHRIVALLLYITTPNDRSHPRYKFCIAIHPMARPCARVRIARPCTQAGCVAAPASRVMGPCRRASWLYRGPPPTRPSYPVSRYNPLYRDSDWKMGSSPSCLLPLLQIFFHSFFFSFCSTYWKTTIYIYIYIYTQPHFHVFSRTKNIYFKYFFSRFTHCKTSEKKFSSTHFFFLMCYSPSIQITQHTQKSMLYTPFILFYFIFFENHVNYAHEQCS